MLILRISVMSLVGGQPTVILDSALLPYESVGTSSLSSSFLRSGAFSHTVTVSGKPFLNEGGGITPWCFLVTQLKLVIEYMALTLGILKAEC